MASIVCGKRGADLVEADQLDQVEGQVEGRLVLGLQPFPGLPMSIFSAP